MITLENDSNTGSVVMQYNTSNCLTQQSWIRFRNTHDKAEYEVFVGRSLKSLLDLNNYTNSII